MPTMSSSALTVPGKWSSYNSSTVQHVLTRHASFKTSRSETLKQSEPKRFDARFLPTKSADTKKSIEERYPLLHFSDDESSKNRDKQAKTLTLPKLVGKQSVLNKVYATDSKRLTELRDSDNYTMSNLEVRVPGSTIENTLKEFKARITKVESEKNELQKQINALYSENKSLRMRIDTADQPGIDSYRQVLQDRALLREAEENYKTRIARLEKELKDAQKSYQSLTEENKKLKEISTKKADSLENQSKYNNLYWKWNALKKENEKLRNDIEILMKLSSKSNVQILLGRGLKDLDPAGSNKAGVKSQFNNVFEERNALRLENKKLQEDVDSLKKQVDQRKDDSEGTSDNKSLKSSSNGYQKLYYENDKKAELYKRIMQLEHENKYLSLSNNNLLGELRQLQSKCCEI